MKISGHNYLYADMICLREEQDLPQSINVKNFDYSMFLLNRNFGGLLLSEF